MVSCNGGSGIPSEQRTIFLNAKAIALLQHCREKEALDCFKKALDNLRIIVCGKAAKAKAAKAAKAAASVKSTRRTNHHNGAAARPAPSECSASSSSSSSSSSSLSTCKRLQLQDDGGGSNSNSSGNNHNNNIVVNGVVAPAATTTSSPLTVSPDNAFTISNRAFTISGGSASQLVSTEHHDLTTTVFLYNTGLAFHRRAIQCVAADDDNNNGGVAAEHDAAAARPSRYLKQALQLYKAAYLSSLNHKNRHRGSRSLDALLISLANNMGHIHSHFYDHKQTKELRAMLLRLLQTSRGLRFHEDDSVSFFLDGVACFSESEIKSASAA